MKPRLIVIAGPNGSGKTSITEQFLKRSHEWIQGCDYINPDNIAQKQFGDWNNPNSVLSAAQFANDLRERLLSERKDFAFETVLSTPEKVDFLKRASEQGYFIRMFFVGTDHPKINASRIVSRMEDGGHSVPIEKIVSRYSRSMENALRIAQFSDRAYFYDNSKDVAPNHIPDWKPLFRTELGRVVEKYPSPNAHPWAAEIYEMLKKSA